MPSHVSGPLCPQAQHEGKAIRRAFLRSGMAAASTAFLAQMPALAAWEEFEDEDGSSVWVNSETGQESKTDPTKKKVIPHTRAPNTQPSRPPRQGLVLEMSSIQSLSRAT
jgi:hypothetical protein